MWSDGAQLLLLLLQKFFSDPKILAMIGVTTLAILLMGLTGRGNRPLSREALLNTLTTFAILAANLLLAPAIYLATHGLQMAYGALHVPSLGPAFWADMPWLVTLLVAIIGKDFCDYWSHRAMHAPLFWPIHAVHHSDSHVNGFTSFRVHALEAIFMQAFYITLLSWLGIPPQIMATAYIIASLYNAYVHFEIDIDHGRLNWLFASPRFHRWHHADLPEAYGKNLANMIPAWDMLFGTYHAAGPCHEPMGLAKDGIPATDPVKLLLLPFAMWGRRLNTAAAGFFARLRRA